MQTSISRSRLSHVVGRAVAVTFFAASCAGLHAQQSAGTAQTLPTIDLKTSLAAPLDLSTPSDLNYSSSVGSSETATAENFLVNSEDTQPPPRRRYSRPNYNDSRTNPDGSAKYTFEVGGGFTLPVGGTHSYLTTGWKFQGGAGRNFNKTFGVLVQFDYDDFGFQTATLNDLITIYNSLGGGFSSISGHTHDWSFTLNPIINYYTSDTKGAYVVGGLGFYHKNATITTPALGQYCEFYGCFTYEANQTIDEYTSNAFGVNAGLGFTYKISRFASTRLFVEGRYVYTFNSPRPFDISGTTSYFNALPQNSAKTTYIPVTFGLRF
jgi:hypothetical protein